MESGFIWMDGDLVPYAEAKVHVITSTLQQSAGVTEGILVNLNTSEYQHDKIMETQLILDLETVRGQDKCFAEWLDYLPVNQPVQKSEVLTDY